MKIAEVIVDIVNSEVDKVFDYRISEDFLVNIGDMVSVPFGNRSIYGFVLNIKDYSDYDLDKLKEVKEVLLPQIIKPELIQLVHNMKSDFYLKYIDLIKLVIPSEIRNGNIHNLVVKYVTLNHDIDIDKYLSTLRKNSKNPILIVKYLEQKGEETYTNLAKNFSSASLKKMIDDGVVIVKERTKNRLQSTIFKEKKDVVLNKYQQEAVDAISNSKYNMFLLHGVTGSGKTEVYTRIIRKCLAEKKTAIMLVPEISLTPQMVSIFTSTFGSDIAVIHSGLSSGEKFDEWNRIYKKEAKIVVGARSAIFTPIENVGVIIIDEEHDNSYVSDSNPRYETYKVAKLRAKYNDCPVVLGSATPNIESYYKSEKEDFVRLELPIRANNKEMPTIEIIDMLAEFKSGNTSIFSNRLIQELSNTIKRNNQAIIFINRRGFSSFVSCKACGYIPRCPACDLTLSYHKECGELKCHYCGNRFRSFNKCPECGSDEIKLGGTGTQKVVEDLKNIFPNIPIFRMDMDTTKTKNSHANILAEFARSKPSILVGTQMIAKGHDFPEVDLVGILDADLSLFFGEYRASEKTFQLITQVAGRAGRSSAEGRVVLQTYFPNNYVYNLVANYNYSKFYEKEINLRQTTHFPPFAEIIRILISSENENNARNYTRDIFNDLKALKVEYKNEIYFLQAMQSPLSKLKNKYRFQVVLRFNRTLSKEIVSKIYQVLDKYEKNKVSVFVENNPLSLS
ncbi:MAG: primosomal protein N' [Clostridiales bacterium]|nr:primosomal protein N' [Clostridiales bacterium]